MLPLQVQLYNISVADRATIQANEAALKVHVAALETDKAALQADVATLEADKAALQEIIKELRSRLELVEALDTRANSRPEGTKTEDVSEPCLHTTANAPLIDQTPSVMTPHTCICRCFWSVQY